MSTTQLSRTAGFLGLVIGSWALAAGASRWLGPSVVGGPLPDMLPWQVGVSSLALAVVMIAGAWRFLRRPGEAAPRELPILAGLIVLSSAIGVSHALARRDAQQATATAIDHAEYLRLQIATQARIRIQALERMERRWEFRGAVSREQWEHEAALNVGDFGAFWQIAWWDSTGVPRWGVPHGGTSLASDAALRRNFAGAREGGGVTVTSPVALPGGGSAIVAFVPVQINGRFAGTIAGWLDLAELIRFATDGHSRAGFAFAVLDDTRELHRFGATPGDARPAAESTLRIHDVPLTIRTWRTSDRITALLPYAVLAAGAMLAALLALSIAMTQRAIRRAREVVATNRKLSKAQAELVQLSILDPVTGLYNRRGFQSHAERYLLTARRTGASFVMFAADLDGLKRINDTYGHAEGDAAIAAAADVLRQTFRASDIVGRMGGDEFAVLVTDTSVESVPVILSRLERWLDIANARGERRWELSMSVGMVDCSPGEELDSMVARADAAAYEQKRMRAVARV